MTLATRLTVGALAGTLLLLTSGCATGSATAQHASTDDLALRTASGSASTFQEALLYLDEEDYRRLRDAIESGLDSDLHAICAMLENPSIGSSASREAGRAVLHRVAEYRTRRPQPYSPDRDGQMLQGCLIEALDGEGDQKE